MGRTGAWGWAGDQVMAGIEFVASEFAALLLVT